MVKSEPGDVATWHVDVAAKPTKVATQLCSSDVASRVAGDLADELGYCDGAIVFELGNKEGLCK